MCSKQSTPYFRPTRISSSRCACATIGLPPLLRGLDDGLHLVVRHLVLVDQLDEVDAGVDQLLHLGARVVGAVDAPAHERLVLEVRPVLDEGTRDVEARPGDLARGDPLLDVQDLLERRAEVAHGRDAAHQQLLRRDRHDLVAEARHVGLVPVLVVRVAEDHQVDVHVHQSGQHAHAGGVDHGRAGRAPRLRRGGRPRRSARRRSARRRRGSAGPRSRRSPGRRRAPASACPRPAAARGREQATEKEEAAQRRVSAWRGA